MRRPALLDVAARRTIVLDGATGTGFQAMDLPLSDFDGLEGCNEVLNLSCPQAVRELHAGYLAAGADAVLTNTFGASAVTLAEYGLEERTYEINKAAAEHARAAADRFGQADAPRFAIGSLGPGTKLPSLGQIDFDPLHAAYLAQARGLLDGGVDALLVETVYDLLQGKAAILACRDALAERGLDTPIFATVTIETTGQMLVGSEIGAALTALAPLGLAGVGLNCATGPDLMHEPLRFLAENAPFPLLCSPNAGLPRVEDGQTVYDLTPDGLADALAAFIGEYGVSIVGGCCGTSAEHVRAVSEQVRGVERARRTGGAGGAGVAGDKPRLAPGAASLFSAVPYKQDASFLIVGERANANGSRRFKRLLDEERWEEMANVVRDQAGEGAHVADLCVDFVGRDGVPDMERLVGKARGLSTLPLMLDSTEPPVLEAGLKLIGGKAIVNSINLEDGDHKGSRLDRTLSAAVRFGAGVVALSIDEQGQARTCERKVEIAARLHRIATEDYGLSAEDLFFDALTLPLGSGQDDLRRDGIETLEAIAEISRRFPRSQTILGVSNISFGLNPAARQVLNSVFLQEAVDRGLTAAIVHAAQILPAHQIDARQREAALRLIHNEWVDGADPLVEFMALFEGVSLRREESDLAELSIEQRLHRRIVDGLREGLRDDLDEALRERPALEIINGLLLPAMQEVGDLFGAGKMQLPFVLQSAETMKASVSWLEPHMERSDAAGKGTIVLATVRGDVHDIGKNLVDIILSNNGFTTVNLGIKQPIGPIIEAAEQHDADAIGLSGLLVKSTLVMREDLEELNRRGLAERWPILLGGAALTRGYVETDLRECFAGRVWYGQDAFEGLRIMNALAAGEPPPHEIAPRRAASTRGPKRQTAPSESTEPQRTAPAQRVPEPPFLGTRVVHEGEDGLALAELFPYINETALFRGQWGFRNRNGQDAQADWAELVERDARPALRRLQAEALADGVLEPAVVYGYFPAQSDGDDLIIYVPESGGARAELARFAFPRQQGKQGLCLADYFRPVDSGELDVVGFHVVTMGRRVSERAAELFAADRYQDYLYWHGFGVELAEALAEFWHRRMRAELGIDAADGATPQDLFKTDYQGARYSFGYPACPNLEDQQQLWRLLEPERIGATLSEQWQIEPEQSTSALIVHHPEARYFAI